MENLTVAYDYTVRDASGRIVQFQYGDDSLDAVKIVRLPIPKVQPPYNYHFDHLSFDDEKVARYEQSLISDSIYAIQEWKQQFGESKVSCCVDLEALIERAQMLSTKPCSESFRTIHTAVQDIINLCDIPLFKHVLQLYLQLKIVMQIENRWAFWLFQEIKDKMALAKVHPGEMVGVLSGQSVSEPATQM